MSQGEILVLDEHTAKKSMDLEHLKQIGAVKVEYLKRTETKPIVQTIPVKNATALNPPPPDLATVIQQQLEALRKDLPILIDKAVDKALSEKLKEFGVAKKRGK
jgi:hypothetical protein